MRRAGGRTLPDKLGSSGTSMPHLGMFCARLNIARRRVGRLCSPDQKSLATNRHHEFQRKDRTHFDDHLQPCLHAFDPRKPCYRHVCVVNRALHCCGSCQEQSVNDIWTQSGLETPPGRKEHQWRSTSLRARARPGSFASLQLRVLKPARFNVSALTLRMRPWMCESETTYMNTCTGLI